MVTNSRNNHEVHKELDKIYLNQLPAICLVVAGYYGSITLMHFLFLPDHLLVPVASSSALACFAALFLRFLVKKNIVPEAWSHASFVPVLLAVGYTVYCHIFLSGEQIQLSNAVLALFGCGLVVMAPWAFTLVASLYAITYIIALIILDGPYMVHFAFMLFAAVTVSILGFLLRYKALYRSVRLLAGNRQKTRRLAQATREIEQKMIEAQEANAARDTFIANITHELRTPLTGVMGMLDLVKDSDTKEDQTYLLDTARKSASYLLHVVNDLLDFAKLEAGKIELKIRPFDPKDITHTAVETFRGAASTKGITLDFDTKEAIPAYLEGDANRISQILLNLINNAVKFTEEGSVSITLAYDASRLSAIWQVRDTGPGISPDKLHKLFERFEQADGSATTTKSGTGLGLAIVDELVSLMHGTITVSSELDQGSVFTLTLPLGECLPEQNEKPGMAAQAEDNSAFSGASIKILLAEDNEINQMLIARMLKKVGITDIRIVDNGEKAVEQAADPAQTFDLILMDMRMPVMDGITAARTLKKRGIETPVIAITANTLEKDLAEYEAAGIKQFIGKPIDINQFQRAISETLLNR